MDGIGLLSTASRVLISANSPPTFKSLVIPQVSAASVSFVASFIMTVTIARTGSCLSVPYRRIIFGLGIADVAQSLGLLLGPVFVPSDTPNCWGQGSSMTCRISAFLLTAGMIAVPMYTCFISWYYLCKLKFRISDENFTNKTELKIHILIVITVSSITFMALILDTFHTVPAKTHCQIAATPLGCRVYPNFRGACDFNATFRADAFTVIIQSFRGVCISAMFVMMSMIYWHVTQQIRAFDPGLLCCRRTAESSPNQHQSREDVSYLSSLYRNEIVIQTSCFVAAFCLTYVPDSLIFFIVKTGGRPSSSLQFAVRFLFPLGGLFNILVHCRPKVASLQRDHPDRWWFHCLWLVLRAGGEIPERAFSNFGDDDELQRADRPHFSFSSVRAFGVRNEIAFNRRGMSSSDDCISSVDPEEA